MVNPADAERSLRDAEWLGRPETQALFAALGGDQRLTRAVGGIVRDTILGIPERGAEIDLATELTPDAVTRRATAAGIAAYPTGIEHGTVTLRLGETVAEVTTLREDVATDGRHAVVRFGTDWASDAARRDFTMNALYASADGALFDPLGGLDDVLVGRVRFIGDPDQRIAEDRLRVYRFFRFSASHGGQHLDASGLAACRRAAGTLDRLSAERVGSEMRRMLSLPKVAATLSAMADARILEVAPQTLHRLTRYERGEMPTLTGRLALLIVGTDRDALQLRWRLSNAEVAAATTILDAAALLGAGAINEAAYRHPSAVAEAVPVAAAIGDWSEARTADVRGTLKGLAVPPFPVSGTDLTALGLAPGRALGEALSRLETEWIESGFSLSKHELLARL